MQAQQPFRLMLIFNDQFATLQAVPLNGVASLDGRQTVGGMVQGKEGLLSLISDAESARLAAEEARTRAALMVTHSTEARRRLRLMEELEKKKFRAWQTEADREQENLASEFFLARWKR